MHTPSSRAGKGVASSSTQRQTPSKTETSETDSSRAFRGTPYICDKHQESKDHLPVGTATIKAYSETCSGTGIRKQSNLRCNGCSECQTSPAHQTKASTASSSSGSTPRTVLSSTQQYNKLSVFPPASAKQALSIKGPSKQDRPAAPTRPARPAELVLDIPPPPPTIHGSGYPVGPWHDMLGHNSYYIPGLGLQCDINLPPRTKYTALTEPDPAYPTVASTPTSARPKKIRQNNIVKLWFADKDTQKHVGRAEIEVDSNRYEFSPIVVKLSKKQREEMEGVVNWRCVFPLNEGGKRWEKAREGADGESKEKGKFLKSLLCLG